MSDTTHRQNETTQNTYDGRLIQVSAGAVDLNGIIFLPQQAKGQVILTYGIETLEENPHRTAINLAQVFHTHNIATLIVDLFSSEERELDAQTGYFRLNTEVMQQRIIGLAEWLMENPETAHLSPGYFGSGIAGAAALIAAAERPDIPTAVVVAGGPLVSARSALPGVLASTLLIAAEQDEDTVKSQQEALALLQHNKQFEPVPGVSSLFADQHSLDKVARLASAWFERWLLPLA
jgi:putative phosphoribosyl transferase